MHQQPTFTTAFTQPGPPVYELSGWWRRAGAEIIDGALIWITGSIIINLFGLGSGWNFNTGDSGTQADFHVSGWPILIYFALAIAFMGGVLTYTNGKTIGMMATNIRVVREDGAKIEFGFAFYRQNVIKGILFGWVAVFTLYIATLLNYLWPLWDDKNQALHDKICNTRVVCDTIAQQPEPYVGTTVPPQYPPPAPPPPAAPPVPPGTYQPPPDFENPVPDDKR